MIRENINSKKGITLISLIITVIILFILSSIIISGISNSNNVEPYNNMIADITLLEEKILIYYNKYEEIPKTGTRRQINGIGYYEIDLSKLENLTLNYGLRYKEDTTDIYLVNDNLKVYYLKGTEKSNQMYHTDSD